MQLASSPVFYEPPLAAMPQLSEKPRQGFETWKMAWKPGPNVPNSTVAIGLRAGLALEGVRKTYRARYYNPTTGRFLSEDPAGFGGSGTNLYAYVGNSPINFIDPFGLGILPTNPSGLGPQWQPDPSHLDPNGSRWVNPDGDYLDFHPGRPGMPGWRGKDHWHNNGCKKHLAPGDEVPEETTAPVPAPEPEPEPEPSTGPSEPGPLQQVINWAEAHPGVVIAGAVVVGGTVIILTGGAGALILAPAL